jgi:hypothetical protein
MELAIDPFLGSMNVSISHTTTTDFIDFFGSMNVSCSHTTTVISHTTTANFVDIPSSRLSLVSPSVWLTLFAVYAMFCSLLRFRLEKAMRGRFNYPDRDSLARMTNDDAQAIVKYILDQEFPFMFKTSLQFAIFKVCSSFSSEIMHRRNIF